MKEYERGCDIDHHIFTSLFLAVVERWSKTATPIAYFECALDPQHRRNICCHSSMDCIEDPHMQVENSCENNPVEV